MSGTWSRGRWSLMSCSALAARHQTRQYMMWARSACGTAKKSGRVACPCSPRYVAPASQNVFRMHMPWTSSMLWH
eukprot:1359475-Pyramimonas_sp.AAC.1